MQIYKFIKQIKSTRKFKVQGKNKCELLIWFTEQKGKRDWKRIKVQDSKMISNRIASLTIPLSKSSALKITEYQTRCQAAEMVVTIATYPVPWVSIYSKSLN